MNKHQTKELKHIIINWFKYWKWNDAFLNEKEYLKKIINHIFEDTNNWKKEYSDLDTEIFWKLNPEKKQKFFDYIDWKVLDKETKKELNIFWKKIIDLLSSVYSEVPTLKSKTLENRIDIEMKKAWQALERFIIYSINTNWTDINLKIKKSKNEYEWNKIDFVVSYEIYLKNKKIQFANQLTAWFDLKKKKSDLNNLAYSLDNPQKQVNNKQIAKLNKDNYREEDIPDLPILFYVRNWLQNIAKDFKDSNLFNNAYKELWDSNILENVWNNKKEKEKNKKYLLSIWKSYPVLISIFLKKIKKIDLNKDYSEKNIKEAKWIVDLNYNSKNNIFSIKYRKNNTWYKDDIEYWLDFYITNKFLKKMWIEWNIIRFKKFNRTSKYNRNYRFNRTSKYNRNYRYNRSSKYR